MSSEQQRLNEKSPGKRGFFNLALGQSKETGPND